MKIPDLPANEPARLQRLHSLQLLDTAAEDVLDGFTKLAANITGMPIALLSLVDSERQWFKSAVGLPQGDQTPRAVSFCGHAIGTPDLFEVEDSRVDARFADNPLVTGQPHVVHYAGAPLVMPGGEAIGTLCVIGPEPGRLDPGRRALLQELAGNVVKVLLLREKERNLDRERALADAAELAELVPVGMFSAAADGRILYGSAQWRRLLGVEGAADGIDAGWQAAIDPQDLPALERGWQAAIAAREPFVGVARTREAVAGEGPRWLRFRLRPVEARFAPVAFVGMTADVTQTVELEHALQNKNELLECIIEHLPCGISVRDGDRRHIVSNQTMRRMLDLGDGDCAGGHPAFESPDRELTLRDGTVVDVRGTAMPDGGLITTYSDVTASRRAAVELQASKERLTRALEASGLGLWEYDLRTGEVCLSQGWAGLLDVPAPDGRMKAAQMLQLVPPHEHDRMRAGLARLLAGEDGNLSLEHEVCGPGGRRTWFLSEAQVMERAADGRVLMVVGTCKDITARMEADAALRAAMQAADQANQAKSDFLATMSHEIRTPLNGVIGMTQLLAAADLPPTARRSTEVIDSCAKSLLSLVDNILDFSKIEAGRLTLDEAPTDLAALVREVGDVFAVRAADKGLRFLVQTEARVPRWVRADRGRLRQILLNLLGNALKFTENGGFSLDVGTTAGAGGDCVTFVVKDTGIGIAEADQARLFTRFTQVDASASRDHHGTGLGLAISRQLAQLMGGDVTLASRRHAGSTFTLRIPLRVATAQDEVHAESSTAVRQDASILLAEDNEINQLVALSLLESLGYRRVAVANDGRQALEACAAQQFDLILMDCQMPVVDGWEATRQLRARGVRTPILALTASATSGDREKCLQAGMDDYLTKPIERAVLGDKVNRWLDRPPVPAAVPAAAALPPAFDPAVVANYFAGDRALFAQVRQLFLNQTRKALPELRAACGGGDVATLRQLAHRIRGTAATVGAAPLAAACRWIEEAQDATRAELEQALGRLEAGFAAFEAQSEAEAELEAEAQA